MFRKVSQSTAARDRPDDSSDPRPEEPAYPAEATSSIAGLVAARVGVFDALRRGFPLPRLQCEEATCRCRPALGGSGAGGDSGNSQTLTASAAAQEIAAVTSSL